MIIRLTNADFSRNNLGQIQFEREITEETLTLLSKYTKSLPETQKFAVQDFISGLKSNDIWSQIKQLYLPILSGSLSETMYNVKTGIVDATPNNTYYSLSAKGGLKCIAAENVTIPTSDILQLTVNGSQQNVHGLVYHVENIPETMTYNEIPFMGVVSTLVFQASFLSTGYLEGKLQNSGGTGRSGTFYSKTPALQGFTSGTDGIRTITTEVSSTLMTLASDITYTNFPIHLLKPSTTARPSLTSYGLVSIGSALTVEQAETYKRLSDSFMAKMGVTI